MNWPLLSDIVIALHYGFLLYLIVGGFIAWRWPWTIVAHLLAAVWAVFIVATSVECPLTALQNVIREHAGQARLRGGFIDLYVQGVLYPSGWDMVSQIVVGLVVLGSWIGFVRRARTSRRTRASRTRLLVDSTEGRLPRTSR
jgi:hypothetical protein